MGFLIKFLLGFVVIYFLLKSFVALMTGKKNGKNAGYQRQKPPQSAPPESQEERILEYQKKNFEKSEVEDADFTEIKNN